MVKGCEPVRGKGVVIPGRGGGHWININDQHDRDVPLGDPAMGGHASFALGRALARPDERVILFDAEGDILMNLGALPTIAEKNNMPLQIAENVVDEHTPADMLGRVFSIAKPKLGVGTHFFTNEYTIDEAFAGIASTYAGPVVIAQDLMVINVTHPNRS